jgi:TRAP-type C4-dicarboxylate transport system permease small subunit
MRRIIRAIDTHFEYVLSSALYAYIIVVIFCEVVARYGFHSSILWAEETSIYAFIWLTYISMANLAKTRSHLAFTPIRDMLPPAGQLTLLLLADVCLLILSTVIIVFIYRPLADNIIFEQKMMGANLPLWWATAAVPFGWLLVAIRVIQRALISIRKYTAGDSLVSEVVALE